MWRKSYENETISIFNGKVSSRDAFLDSAHLPLLEGQTAILSHFCRVFCRTFHFTSIFLKTLADQTIRATKICGTFYDRANKPLVEWQSEIKLHFCTILGAVLIRRAHLWLHAKLSWRLNFLIFLRTSQQGTNMINIFLDSAHLPLITQRNPF